MILPQLYLEGCRLGDIVGGHGYAPIGSEGHALLLQERLLELGEHRVALVDAEAAVAADHAPPRDVDSSAAAMRRPTWRGVSGGQARATCP
jgi:hypothetical protein